MADDAYDVERRRASAKSPAGRLGTPEDVGLVVLFLSSTASGFITGARPRDLPVDGGFTITAF